MTLPDFWRRLPPYAKRLFWASILLGVICLALGLYGDAHEFWAKRNFGANVFTSLTGALFGIPFAVTIITWFSKSLETRVSQSAAKAL